MRERVTGAAVAGLRSDDEGGATKTVLPQGVPPWNPLIAPKGASEGAGNNA